MMKMVLAILAGVICGLVVVVAGEIGVGLMFSQSPLASLLILASWLLSAFVAGAVAGRFGPNWKRASLFAGAILLATNVPTMLSVPQPMWINVIGFLAYFLLAYAGGRLVNRA